MGKHIKALRLDRGSVSSGFDPFHKEYGIILQLCVSRTPLQNKVLEKKISNFVTYSEIDDWFLITSHILLGINLETMLYLLYLRGISVYKMSKRILGVITFIVKSSGDICLYKC